MRIHPKAAIRNAVRLTVVLFLSSVVLMVHDSMGLNDKLSPDELQSIMATRPPLVDPLGQPVKVSSEEEYQKDLLSGLYIADSGARIPFISPHGEIAALSPTQISVATVKGWRVESLEHQADRVLEAKQQNSMWLTDWPGLFLHVVLCQFSAILLLGAIFLARSLSKKSFFDFISLSSDV
jgi:hypothetical protein